jgi:hypothetical protein
MNNTSTSLVKQVCRYHFDQERFKFIDVYFKDFDIHDLKQLELDDLIDIFNGPDRLLFKIFYKQYLNPYLNKLSRNSLSKVMFNDKFIIAYGLLRQRHNKTNYKTVEDLINEIKQKEFEIISVLDLSYNNIDDEEFILLTEFIKELNNKNKIKDLYICLK